LYIINPSVNKLKLTTLHAVHCSMHMTLHVCRFMYWKRRWAKFSQNSIQLLSTEMT